MTLNFFNKHNKPPEEKPKEFWRLKDWFNDIPEESINKLKLFNSEIIKLNPSLNLVSEKTIPFLDVIHFADCIMACRAIVKEGKPSQITDIGLGNGFPSVILSVLYPEIKVVMLDKDPRKVEFIGHTAKILNLKNLDSKAIGLDSLGPASLDIVVMRSPIVITKALLALRKQVKKGGSLYMLKSEEWATEVANIPSQLCSYWTPSLVGDYRLPVGEVKFAVIKLKKIAD